MVKNKSNADAENALFIIFFHYSIQNGTVRYFSL